MRLIMRLFRFMCLTLVMCIGLTVFAQEPEIKVTKSGEQATSVKNNKNHDVTIYLHYDNNKPQRSVKLASGESYDIEADCYKIMGDGKKLYSRNKRNESANEPSPKKNIQQKSLSKPPPHKPGRVRVTRINKKRIQNQITKLSRLFQTIMRISSKKVGKKRARS